MMRRNPSLQEWIAVKKLRRASQYIAITILMPILALMILMAVTA